MSKSIVPFRQCKLTELLFSNSFPTHTSHRPGAIPQKGLMIVTADPTGDFNATSQILRYSALAREITVPRIPSVTSQILANGVQLRPGSSSSNSSGSFTPSTEQLAELARLADESMILSLQLEDERHRREEAEMSWAASEQRIADMEEQIRAECWTEMEDLMALEKRRWLAMHEAQAETVEERVDAKIELLASQTEEGEAGQGVEAEEMRDEEIKLLREENERLRARIDLLEREKLLKTPSGVGKKQRVLKSRKWEAEEDLDVSG
jgi:hypothetical protein